MSQCTLIPAFSEGRLAEGLFPHLHKFSALNPVAQGGSVFCDPEIERLIL